jgi:hypothetical protein
VQVDEVAEAPGSGYARRDRSLAAIDLALGLHPPGLRIVVSNERLIDVPALSPDLDRQEPDLSRVIDAIFVCAPCALTGRKMAKNGVKRRKIECTRRHLTH